MNKIALKTGLWSAMVCLASFVIWTIAFVGIAFQSTLFTWTNLDDYIAFVQNQDQTLAYLAKTFMVVFSLAFMVLAFILQDTIKTERKILVQIGVLFSVLFALVSSMHYFVQISSVRFALNQAAYSGLEHFVQANPTSFLSAVNMMGWTLFLGLSGLFLYLGLQKDKTLKGIRFGLVILVVSCLFGGIGYLFQINILTFVFMNLGIGAAFFGISVASVQFFYKHLKTLYPEK